MLGSDRFDSLRGMQLLPHPCALPLASTTVQPDDLSALCLLLLVGTFFPPDMVATHRSWLKFPAENTLTTGNFFHGFLDFAETVRTLAVQPPGTYLLRFSRSKPGYTPPTLQPACWGAFDSSAALPHPLPCRSLVVAFVNDRGQVQQSIVYSRPELGGYLLGQESYASIQEYVLGWLATFVCLVCGFAAASRSLNGLTHGNPPHKRAGS